MPKSAYTQDYACFRAMLVEARTRGALTQAELASRLRRPQSFVSKYESGERRLDHVEFLEVARALGVEAADFILHLQRRIEEASHAD